MRHLGVDELFVLALHSSQILTEALFRGCVKWEKIRPIFMLVLRKFVCPGMLAFFGEDNTIADVLSFPLLWACFDPLVEARIDPVVKTRIWEAYFLIRRLDVGVNPAKKVQLTIYRVADQVCIDELVDAVDKGQQNYINNQEMNPKNFNQKRKVGNSSYLEEDMPE